jgi:hypothetical protein
LAKKINAFEEKKKEFASKKEALDSQEKELEERR